MAPLLQSGYCSDPSEVSVEPFGWVGGGACKTLGFFIELKCCQGYKTLSNDCLCYKILFLILKRYLLK